MKRIAIFVSGSGSNAEKIVHHFASSGLARVELILSNNPGAYALQRAERLSIESAAFDRTMLYGSAVVLDMLRERRIDYIVLAGFLWLVPGNIIEAFRGRIINIHPALLPKYGGKGMYGGNVHRAVIAAGEKESGITIHHVNEAYDNGDVILQMSVSVDEGETPQSLAAKIHELEHEWFPKVIEEQIGRLP